MEYVKKILNKELERCKLLLNVETFLETKEELKNNIEEIKKTLLILNRVGKRSELLTEFDKIPYIDEAGIMIEIEPLKTDK